MYICPYSFIIWCRFSQHVRHDFVMCLHFISIVIMFTIDLVWSRYLQTNHINLNLYLVYLLYMHVCWNLITLYICFRKNIKNVGKSQQLYLVELRWCISVLVHTDFVIYVYLTRICRLAFYQIWLCKICRYTTYLDIK